MKDETISALERPIVYTAGAFDLLHKGHVRVIRRARALGNSLIVGVSPDDLVMDYKGRTPVVPYDERVEIVEALRGVDAVVPQHTRDKYGMWQALAFDIWAVGDDWREDHEVVEWVRRLEAEGVTTVFLPYTQGVSTTERRKARLG